jgi:hypothetical protein
VTNSCGKATASTAARAPAQPPGQGWYPRASSPTVGVTRAAARPRRRDARPLPGAMAGAKIGLALSFSARPLIVVYAALTLLLNLVVALPGNPDYTSGWGFVVAAVIQSLLIWRLWRASEIAWLLGLLSALVGVVSAFLIGGPYDLTEILFVVVSAAQGATLASPAIASFAWPREKTPATSR